ncbi:tetratricopeptide repeat protein [Streptomyces sp. NPDC055134]
MFRLLAMDNPDAHLPSPARALSNLSNTHSRLGVPEDALQAAEEAVAINKRLAESNPTAFLFQLAVSLQHLSDRLSAVGQQDESIRVGEQAAVAIEESARRQS